MVAKRGRPIIENSKDYMLRVRMNSKTMEQLDLCCKNENKSRSEIVRECIEDKYNRIKK
jgi:predicted DNA-binding protein